jgi:sugar phosphate isomerase/epimerase
MEIGTFARNNDQIREALKHDPDFIDLRMDLDHSITFSKATEDLNDADVPCTFHLPSHPDWKPMDLSQGIVPYIDIAADIGAELVTIHSTLSTLMYSDQDIDTFLDAVHLAVNAAENAGVPIAVETLGLYYTELTLLFDSQPAMQLCLDLGHGQIMAHRNRALGHIDSFFDRIEMVNVHDNHGEKMIDEVLEEREKRNVSREEIRELANRYDEHLAIGEGDIDFECIFKELKERHYDGRFLMMCADPSRFPEEREKFMRLWLEA